MSGWGVQRGRAQNMSSKLHVELRSGTDTLAEVTCSHAACMWLTLYIYKHPCVLCARTDSRCSWERSP